jgi:hypothetical protein
MWVPYEIPLALTFVNKESVFGFIWDLHCFVKVTMYHYCNLPNF